jgi:hypothetical protein
LLTFLPAIAAANPAFAQTIGWLFTAGPGVFVNGRAAASGTPVNSNDTVATGADSSASIQIAVGGSVQLDAGTQTQFLSFVQASFGCVVHAVLNSGQLYADGTSACVSRGASFIVPQSEFNYQAIPGAEVLTVTAGQVSVAGAQWTPVPAGAQATLAGGRIVAQRRVGPGEMRRITGWRDRFRFTQTAPPPPQYPYPYPYPYPPPAPYRPPTAPPFIVPNIYGTIPIIPPRGGRERPRGDSSGYPSAPMPSPAPPSAPPPASPPPASVPAPTPTPPSTGPVIR